MRRGFFQIISLLAKSIAMIMFAIAVMAQKCNGQQQQQQKPEKMNRTGEKEKEELCGQPNRQWRR